MITPVPLRRVWAKLALPVVLLACIVPADDARASSAPARSTASDDAVHDSDYWIVVAEKREAEGDHAGAALAQMKVFEAFDEEVRRSEVGAYTVLAGAENSWRAYADTGEIEHLRSGKTLLERWIDLAGEDSTVDSAPTVRDESTRMGEVLELLELAQSRMTAGDVEAARTDYVSVLRVLSGPAFQWSVGARVACRSAQEHLDSYDDSVDQDEQVDGNLWKLETARGFLEDWRDRRPSDDDSSLGGQVQMLHGEVMLRIQQAEGRLVALEQRREAQRRQREEDVRRKAEQQAQAEHDAREAQRAKKERRTRIILTTIGGSVAVAGAVVEGLGVASELELRRYTRAERFEGDRLAQMTDGFDASGFEAALRELERRSRVQNSMGIAGGTLLLAGGTATYALGLFRIARGPSRRNGDGIVAKRRRLSIALVAIGATGVAAGSALFVDGVRSSVEARRTVEGRYADALDVLGTSTSFDLAGFEASIRTYEDRARVRATLEISSGSLLLAGGIVTAAAGIAGLAWSRERSTTRRRVSLLPMRSRFGAGLLVRTRF